MPTSKKRKFQSLMLEKDEFMKNFSIITEELYKQYVNTDITHIGFVILDEMNYVYFRISDAERQKPYKQIEEDLKMFLQEELFSYNKMTISFTKPIEDKQQ